jgi:RNA polymerase sigma factor (sigma-70 family)
LGEAAVDPDRTTTQMLEGLADEQNDDVWSRFDERYRPILIGFARSLGLPADDAADVAQDALTTFVVEYRQGKYDRSRGRLRSWLIGIVRYRVLELRRKRAVRREAHGVTHAADLPGEGEMTRLWEQQHEAEIYRRAVEQLKETSRTDPTTLRAFELLVERQLTPQQVADELEISVEDAYRAKSRVAQRLRAIVDELQRLYSDDGAIGADST